MFSYHASIQITLIEHFLKLHIILLLQINGSLKHCLSIVDVDSYIIYFSDYLQKKETKNLELIKV